MTGIKGSFQFLFVHTPKMMRGVEWFRTERWGNVSLFKLEFYWLYIHTIVGFKLLLEDMREVSHDSFFQLVAFR